MNPSKLTHLTRADLRKMIVRKIERMNLPELQALADYVKVSIPGPARAGRQRSKEHAAGANVLMGSGLGPLVSIEEGRRLLAAVDDESADWMESKFLGTADLVKKLNISRGKLVYWRRTKKIIAFREGFRNFVYPLRQFTGSTPVEGLAVIATFFVSPEDTWEWLVAFNRMTGNKPPIDMLRRGKVALVTSAAEAALDYV